jgi:uncharacterized protein
VTSLRRAPGSRGTGVPVRRAARAAVTPAVVAACVGLALLAGWEGSAGWRALRVLAVVAAGSACLLAREGPRGLQAATVTPLGIVAVIAGAAIGVPHTVGGSWVTGVAGLVALVSGVALLLAVACSFWRPSGWRGRVVLVVVAVAIVQWVVFPVSVAVFATSRVPTSSADRTPADVGLAYRDVTITTGDGVPLAAWYVPSKNGAAVVLLHGSGSTRADVIDHAAALSAGGFGVLLLDARGHGDSGGHEMDLGWHGDADITAAIEHLTTVPDVTGRIGAVGLSMGGEEAIGAAPAIPELVAVVAEGATGRRGSDWLALRPFGIGRVPSSVFYAVQDAAASLLSGADPPTDLRGAVIAAAPRRMLLVAAGEVPQEGLAARRLEGTDPDRVEVWEVPDAQHTGGLAADSDEWTSRVATFLERELLDRTSGAS